LPAVVGDGSLVRIDLAAYAIESKSWESLIADLEPVFHVRSQAVNPTTGKVETVYTDAGHVGLEWAAALRQMTGSTGAIVRADWFIVRATSPPHYYSLAGVPDTLDGWYKSLGADAETIVKLRANKGANLFRSGVTHKPRRLTRWQGPLGGVWQTYDSEESRDVRKDPFRTPGFDGAADAGEHIATKANGLHLFGLYSLPDGKRQDAVPDRIAKDDSDPLADGRLVASVSCIRCHIESGLRPFHNDMKAILARGVDLATTPEEADKLAAFYTTDKLERQLDRDREDYADAVLKATGGKLDAKKLPDAVARVVREYQYYQVDLATAKRELGGVAGLQRSSDPYILAIVTGHKINRAQWEGSYAEAAFLVGDGR